MFCFVQDLPVPMLPDEINANETTEVHCSVQFGFLDNTGKGVEAIYVSALSCIRMGALVDIQL